MVRLILVMVWVCCVGSLYPASTQTFDLDLIKLPDGFSIQLYATDIPNARSMVSGTDGTLFVGTRTRGVVYAIQDTNKDYRADVTYVIAEELNMPNGVAFRDGDLYVAEVSRVLRFDNIEARLKNPPEAVVVNDSFPGDRHHGWKYIAFGPDDRLYVPVGAPCNICERTDDPRFASLMRMNPDGSGLEIVASGIRNTVGFDWHPETGVLWFTDNGRDWMGDNRPPDELNRAPEPGLHFGYPYWHGGDIPDPEFGDTYPADRFKAPEQNLGPHVAALGMLFYTGDQFPKAYRHQIFIAEHGSWNRSEKIGYRVTLVRLKDSTAESYTDFATGWLQEDDRVLGRPVDLLQLPDGSILVSDDHAGQIYRIEYTPPAQSQ